MPETTKEMMNRLYVKYGLSSDNVFVHKHYKIITRAGIEKIAAKAGITLKYFIEKVERVGKGASSSGRIVNNLDVIIKCIATNSEGVTIETYGESSPENTQQTYPVAMAEKRAKSRAVLQLTQLYGEGFFGEDEATEFQEFVKSSRKKVEIKTE